MSRKRITQLLGVTLAGLAVTGCSDSDEVLPTTTDESADKLDSQAGNESEVAWWDDSGCRENSTASQTPCVDIDNNGICDGPAIVQFHGSSGFSHATMIPAAAMPELLAFAGENPDASGDDIAFYLDSLDTQQPGFEDPAQVAWDPESDESEHRLGACFTYIGGASLVTPHINKCHINVSRDTLLDRAKTRTNVRKASAWPGYGEARESLVNLVDSKCSEILRWQSRNKPGAWSYFTKSNTGKQYAGLKCFYDGTCRTVYGTQIAYKVAYNTKVFNLSFMETGYPY